MAALITRLCLVELVVLPTIPRLGCSERLKRLSFGSFNQQVIYVWKALIVKPNGSQPLDPPDGSQPLDVSTLSNPHANR